MQVMKMVSELEIHEIKVRSEILEDSTGELCADPKLVVEYTFEFFFLDGDSDQVLEKIGQSGVRYIEKLDHKMAAIHDFDMRDDLIGGEVERSAMKFITAAFEYRGLSSLSLTVKEQAEAPNNRVIKSSGLYEALGFSPSSDGSNMYWKSFGEGL